MNVAQALFVPPHPDIPTEDFGWYRFYKAVRSNALQIWPRAAYTQDIVVGSIFGRQRLLINSPDAIRRVLVDNTANYGRWESIGRLLHPMLGDGIILSEGEDWRRQRRAIAPTLTPRAMPMLASQVATVVDHAIAQLASTGHREPINLLSAVQLVALEVAALSMFSLEVRPYGDRLRQLLDSFGARLARPDFFDLMLPRIPSLRDVRRMRWRRRWSVLLDEIMATRLQTPKTEAPHDLFDVLLATRDPRTGAAFSHEQIRDQLGTLLVTGHETTTLTIFWSLYLLASVPAEQERVAEEVGEIDLSPEVPDASLSRLYRARSVVNEALRLYPPAFSIARRAIGRDRIGDTEVMNALTDYRALGAAQTSAAVAESRRLRSVAFFGCLAPPRFAFLPFGVGPRVCVGAHFASTEAAIVLAKLIKRFRIELVDQEPVNPVAVLLTVPDRIPLFRLRERS